ncbi:MAG: molybdopterin cofactor-binding domain-containing protein, partial [Pyrinomonadaceae bacterium]
MSARRGVDRRDFLRITGFAGGGLVLGFYLPLGESAVEAAPAPADSFSPNAFIRIGDNDRVTILVGQSEMGQGVLSAFAMVIAEELEVDLSAIDVQNGPAAKEFFNPAFGSLGMQLTGGSASVRGFYPLLRKAGATGRAVLIQAAAIAWGVPASECRAEHGNVLHSTSGKRARYGSLVASAAKLTPPLDAPLKDPKDFRILGKPAKRLDTAPKVNGKAIFGIDVKLPGLLTASVARCPVFGGKVAKFDATKAKAVAGVRQVVQIDAGVAVVADNYWAAKKGRDLLDVTWDEGPNAGMTSMDINDILAGAVAQPGAVARNEGNVDAEWAKVAKKVEAVYEVPYLAHATMEPMNFTA